MGVREGFGGLFWSFGRGYCFSSRFLVVFFVLGILYFLFYWVYLLIFGKMELFFFFLGEEIKV